VRELEVELAAQDAGFWEAEKRAIAAEDAGEHMAAIEWRTKQAEAAKARDAAAESLEQVRRTAYAQSAGFQHLPNGRPLWVLLNCLVQRSHVYRQLCCCLALPQLCGPERATSDSHRQLPRPVQAKANMSAAEAEPATDPDTGAAGSSKAEIEYAEADRKLAEHMAASFRPASSAGDSEEAPRPEVCRRMP